jgi:glycerol-3-phosphate dehydrogenase (NAD(P)+)
VSEIAVIGAGAWGTAISIVLGRKKTHHVRLWAHEVEVRDSVATGRVNQMFLPGHAIPETVLCTNSVEEARRGDRGQRDAFASHAPGLSSDAAASSAGHAVRQRDQGH